MERMLQATLQWFMMNQATQNNDSVAKPYDPLNVSSTRISTHYSFVRRVVLTCLIIFSCITANAQTQTAILTSGNSWTVPSNVYSITVECWGGGGGRSANAGRACGGGGGGAYAKKNSLTVTPGSSISYSIGVGGAGSSTGSGNPGGDTWFSSTSTVLAKGGSGVSQSSSTGGAGGLASSSVGDVKYSGGKGGNGTGSGCCEGAGGGGGAAGSTGAGSAGPNGSANSGLCTSGNDVYGGDYVDEYGGAGGIGVGYDGAGGGAYNYGAGGGGAKKGCASLTNRNGGNGTQGLIRITYCYAPSATSAGSAVAICDGGNTTLSGSATAYSGSNQLLFQDFETSVSGWTFSNTAPAAAAWDWTYNPYPSYSGTVYSNSPSMIIADSDLGGGSGTTTMTSPSINASGFTTLSLNFRQYYNDYSGTDAAYVEVSTNGSSWTTVATYTSDQGSLTSFASTSINLNAYAGNATLYVRFRYVHNNDDAWAIDDISLTGNKTLPITYSWSPSTGLSATNIANPVASPTSTQTYTLTTSHNGCSTTSASVVVTVRPVFNGGTIASSSQVACYGTQPADITYTAAPSGGSTPRYQWYYQTGVVSCPSGTFSGGGWTAIGTASTSTPTLSGATIGNITATTTFALRVDNAGTPACFDNWAGNCHVVYVSGETAPITGDVLATTTSTRTCNVNDNFWHYFRNSAGQIIGAINSNGQNLGNVTMTVTVETTTHDGSYLSPKHGNGGLGRNGDCYGQPELSMRRWYTITPTNQPAAGNPSTIRLFFTSADYTNYSSELTSWIPYTAPAYGLCYGWTSTATDLAVSKNETADIPIASTSLSGGVNNSTQYELSVPSFSTFRFHTSGGIGQPLPVELVSFTGYAGKDKNVLNWMTASERNSDRFEIEKSTSDLSDWYYIGQQKAVGGNVQKAYTFYDNEPTVGHNYYRLKIVDNDGTYTYSTTINIPVDVAMVNGFVKIFPNPTSDVLKVQIQGTSTYTTVLDIKDILGQTIISMELSVRQGVVEVPINVANFASGTYIVSFVDNRGTIHQKKFVKND